MIGELGNGRKEGESAFPEGIAKRKERVGIHIGEGFFERGAELAFTGEGETQGLAPEILKEGIGDGGLFPKGIEFGGLRLKVFDNAGIFLRGDGDKGPFVSIDGAVEDMVAGFAGIGHAGDMAAVGIEGIFSADGADTVCDGTADAGFTFDAAVDIADDILVARGAEDIGPGAQIGIGFTCGGSFLRIGDKIGTIDTGDLTVGGPVMVSDPGFTEEQIAKIAKGGDREAFGVPIDLIVTEEDREGKDIVGSEFGFGEMVYGVDLGIGVNGLDRLAGFTDIHQRTSLSEEWRRFCACAS